MAKEKPAALNVQAFADHHVITQPNPLRRVIRRVDDSADDRGLAGWSGSDQQRRRNLDEQAERMLE